MIDHIGLDVSDYDAAISFYCAALKPLGYELMMEHDTWAGLGADGKPDFWLQGGRTTTPGIHICLYEAIPVKVVFT